MTLSIYRKMTTQYLVLFDEYKVSSTLHKPDDQNYLTKKQTKNTTVK